MDFIKIIAVAILIEALVEYGKSIFQMKDKKSVYTQITTIIIGIALAFAFNVDAFAEMGMAVNHYIGVVLTGIIMSRGSNYASDILKRIAGGTIIPAIGADKE